MAQLEVSGAYKKRVGEHRQRKNNNSLTLKKRKWTYKKPYDAIKTYSCFTFNEVFLVENWNRKVAHLSMFLSKKIISSKISKFPPKP